MALEAATPALSIPARRHLLRSGTRQRSESLGRLTSSTTSARDDKLRVKIHEWLSKLRSPACRFPHDAPPRSGTRQRSESLGRLTSSTTSARDDKLRVKIHEWLSKLRSLACRLPHAVTFFEAERVSVPKASEDSAELASHPKLDSTLLRQRTSALVDSIATQIRRPP
jgi:hypothetical protein